MKILVEQWFKSSGAPKQVHWNEDVRIRSDTGWYKRVLNAMNLHVTTSVPQTYTHAHTHTHTQTHTNGLGAGSWYLEAASWQG